ncbi:hypothetical protein C8R44DRAFT_890551 [Mycena epipterygia]|nr:hypothetical protein C8R44DRAFT_890551 [Mycena epipterygia]
MRERVPARLALAVALALSSPWASYSPLPHLHIPPSFTIVKFPPVKRASIERTVAPPALMLPRGTGEGKGAYLCSLDAFLGLSAAVSSSGPHPTTEPTPMITPHPPLGHLDLIHDYHPITCDASQSLLESEAFPIVNLDLTWENAQR